MNLKGWKGSAGKQPTALGSVAAVTALLAAVPVLSVFLALLGGGTGATWSHLAATVLGDLFPAHATDFTAMADEAGMSRMYGGIHYRSDVEGGKAHGIRIGEHVVDLARRDGAQ